MSTQLLVELNHKYLPANFLMLGISEKMTASAENSREVAKGGNVETGTKPYGVKDKTDSGDVSGGFPDPSEYPGFGLPKKTWLIFFFICRA